MNNKKERQILLWAMLLSSLTGITIWYVRGLSTASFNEWGSVTMRHFSFFTNLTNALIIVMAGTLLYGRGKLYTFFKSPAVQAACSLYIAFVGIGFWFILGGPRSLDTLLDWIPEITAHTLSPILGVVFWFRCVPKGQLTWRHPFIWLSYPIAYLIYWLIRGPLVGYYPYFFLDVDELGYAGVAAWSGILILFYLVLGSLMWLWDRRYETRGVVTAVPLND
ncbi:MAG: hypothetical protein GY943_06660 [Chloroflexi bacterium]|nr:hypothetical protein [Chloroflexota bacterium]